MPDDAPKVWCGGCDAALRLERRDNGLFCAACGGLILAQPTLAERRQRAVQALGLGSGLPPEEDSLPRQWDDAEPGPTAVDLDATRAERIAKTHAVLARIRAAKAASESEAS